MKRSAISGTPRMNSMKITQSILSTGRFDVRPSARRMPAGSEKAMPVTPMTRVSATPPILTVSTRSRPKPPKISHPALKGTSAVIQNRYFRPGTLSNRTGASATSSRTKDRLTRHSSSLG